MNTMDAMQTLTPLDRCDRCGAQAYVRATLEQSELLFCAHHWREHGTEITKIARHLHDETGNLSTKV